MKQTLAQILALQEIARRTEQMRRDIENLSIDVSNQVRLLEELKGRAEQTHDQRIDAAKKADAGQLSIEEAEEHIEHFKVQLNITKHQKEYDALQHAMLSKRADIAKWEDEELDALQAVDNLAAQEAQLAEELERAQSDLKDIRDQVARQSAEKNEGLQELQAEQARMRQQVNPDVLAAYDRLTASNRKNPLAEVRARICQGCFTQITKQTENMLIRGSEIVYCHSCGRMLALADE